MKKVLLIEFSTNGHSLPYIEELSQLEGFDIRLVVPNSIETLSLKQYTVKLRTQKSLISYLVWLNKIFRVIRDFKPDIVHVLYGDNLYRFCGFGFGLIRCTKIITLHWIKNDWFHNLSTKVLSKKFDKIIVHSDFLRNHLVNNKICNALTVFYPAFNMINAEKQKARKYFNLMDDSPVLVCLGAARFDKGLDILLEALCDINVDFQLLIACSEGYFKKDYVEQKIVTYKSRVRLHMHFLDDYEFASALAASDFIVLPYRKMFSGASGPLCEGVWRKKCIIGPNTGNIGFEIKTNHLGYSFEPENIQSLRKTIEYAVNQHFKIDKCYYRYRNKLDPSNFISTIREIYEDTRNDY